MRRARSGVRALVKQPFAVLHRRKLLIAILARGDHARRCLAANDGISGVAARAAEALACRSPVRAPLQNALQNRPAWGGHCRLAIRLDRGIATANLGNTVPVLAIIIIDRLHIEEHELLPGVGIGCPRFRIQLELLFDKHRHCVGIIGNNAPQVVVGQV